ncbi:KDEL motif-containing protein 1 [Elysia marginata]|uniref:KDEL motif-containing protein 1 n=1 Tax=Elysia marginata TaxID=1093978 RepID=A0AAV4GA11_9GAST|nr:KDEL motif-containing protein 1 [Elysia marginata]
MCLVRCLCYFLLLSTSCFFLTITGSDSKHKASSCENVSVKQSRVWGPGLKSDFRLPVRYFFIQLVYKDGSNVTTSVGNKVVSAFASPANGDHARIWTEVLDRHDGSFIVRFRPFSTTSDLKLSVTLRGQHLAESPYTIRGPVYHETCDCPNQTPDQWAASVGCQATYNQIRLDLEPFQDIQMSKVARQAVERFNQKGRHSICHYKVVENKVYRKCYGEHVGFKMFVDAILLSLTRKIARFEKQNENTFIARSATKKLSLSISEKVLTSDAYQHRIVHEYFTRNIGFSMHQGG